MALLTSDIILDSAMERYETQSVIMQLADGRYDPQWADGDTKGDAVQIRLPMYARSRRGDSADPQSMDERLVTLRIPEAFGSDSLLTDRQLSMELNDFNEQVLNPHIDAMVAAISRAAAMTMVMGVSNFVGAPGVAPTTLDTFQDAGRLLTQGGTPSGPGQRQMLVNARIDQNAVVAGRQLQNPIQVISNQYETGSMTGYQGQSLGFNWYLEEALWQHTVGALGGTPRVNGAVTGNGTSSLVTDGWSNSVTGVLKKGDKIQIAGCYMVHPVFGTVYADLQAFTVAQDVDSDGSGNATIPLVSDQGDNGNAIEYGTPYANVSALPADNALISVWGKDAASQSGIANLTFTLGIAMEKSALVFASPNLILPGDVDKLSGRTRSKKMKIGMRVWRASDVNSGRVVTRVDALCGHLVGQARRACLICSI